MHTDNQYISRNGRQHDNGNKFAFRRSNFGSPLFNPEAPAKMEIKLLLTVLGWIGFTSVVLLNIGTIKGNILFGMAFLFGFAKLVRFCLRTWQDFREKELTIKEHKNKIDKGAF